MVNGGGETDSSLLFSSFQLVFTFASNIWVSDHDLNYRWNRSAWHFQVITLFIDRIDKSTTNFICLMVLFLLHMLNIQMIPRKWTDFLRWSKLNHSFASKFQDWIRLTRKRITTYIFYIYIIIGRLSCLRICLIDWVVVSIWTNEKWIILTNVFELRRSEAIFDFIRFLTIIKSMSTIISAL